MNFGIIAGIFTTGALVPQVIKIIKTKDTKSISVGMYFIQIIGLAIWIIHGFMIQDFFIISANIITCALALTILFFKIKDFV